MHEGYIKKWRKIYNHPLHPKNRNRPWTGYEAMEDLIMEAWAGVEPKKIWKGGKTLLIQRGELDKTQRQLAERWRWPLSKVNRFLKHLEDEKTLELKRNTWFTVIVILNYHFFNPLKKQDRNRIETDLEQKRNGFESLKNESNESNESKESNSLVDSEEPTPKTKKVKKMFALNSTEYLLGKHLFYFISEHNPTCKLPDVQKWAAEIDLMIRIDKRHPGAIDFLIHFSQQDQFWHQNILSTHKLREKFDDLMPKAIAWWKKQLEDQKKKEMQEMTF